MKRDKWYGREQFVKNYDWDKRAEFVRKSLKSASASIDELSEAFKKLAKV